MLRKAASLASPGGAIAPPIVQDVLRSPGAPLDHTTRAFFEPRFGHDFSRVRVHTDEKAAESAHAVNASAYTVGSHIAFATAQYAPNSPSGRKLLAHELVHVAQQRHDGNGWGSLSDMEIGSPDDRSEHEANSVTERILRGPGSIAFMSEQLSSSCKVAPQLRRQSDDKKDEGPPLLKWGDYKFDFKPIAPLPIDLPSTEDVNQGIYKLTHKDKPGDLTCAPGWIKIKDGRCCEGKTDQDGTTLNTAKCCAPTQLTPLGTCCPAGQTATPLGCQKTGPNSPDKKDIGGSTNLRIAVPPATPPLTLDLPIHFNHDQPASALSSASALQSALTPAGQSELAGVIGWLQRDATFSAQLTGRASIEGPAEHNTQLGAFRVRSIANALILSGVSARRISDPPGLAPECAEIGVGLHNCGADKASSPKDPDDRQVRVRVFIPPKPVVVGAPKS